MQEKEKSPPLISRLSLIGIVISIVVGIVPIFLNQNWSLALLVALVGIAGTFLLDFGIRFIETGKNFSERVTALEKDISKLVEQEGDDIKRAIKLGDYLVRDKELRRKIEQIVNTCEEVKSLNVDVFTRKVDEYLTKCHEKIHDLADGEEILNSEFSFQPAELSPEKSVAYIVTSSEPHYLDNIPGRRLLDALETSIRLNRDITFVWLQEKQVLSGQKLRKLIQEQQKKGVNVLVAEKESFPLNQQKDYGIIDHRYFYISEITNGRPDREKVSNNQEELRKLAEDFSHLKTFAESAHMYYAHLDQNVNTSV